MPKGMFADSTPHDEWRQHNFAAKYFRAYCILLGKDGFLFNNEAPVQVKKVLHDAKGPGFAFASGDATGKWIWHDMIGQLDSASIDIVCSAPITGCAYELRDATATNGSASFTQDA